jgi:hypothetical protein
MSDKRKEEKEEEEKGETGEKEDKDSDEVEEGKREGKNVTLTLSSFLHLFFSLHRKCLWMNRKRPNCVENGRSERGEELGESRSERGGAHGSEKNNKRKRRIPTLLQPIPLLVSTLFLPFLNRREKKSRRFFISSRQCLKGGSTQNLLHKILLLQPLPEHQQISLS